MRELNLTAARRAAIAATGLAAGRGAAGGPASGRPPDRRHLRAAMNQLHVLQIDAVNAVARSHLLVLRSRMGSEHDHLERLLTRAAYAAGDYTEYWCHEAAYCAVDDWPLFRWKMRRGERGQMWRPLARFGEERRDVVRAVESWLEANGAASAREVAESMEAAPRPPRKAGQWWGWSETKSALGWLFWTGKVGVAERVRFSRRYDLIERVLPTEVLAREPSEPEALRELLLVAAGRLGVATAADLVDYHRLPKREAGALVAELAREGELEPVKVDGTQAYTLPGAPSSRRTSRSVLLSPFDPLVWFRPRAAWLFGFHYRIEIYTPAAKRRYGYYVLPFLHDDRLAARVDVRADRAAGVLDVPGAFAEPNEGGDAGRRAGSQVELTAALAEELWRLSEWLRLGDVRVGRRGDLASALKREVRSGRHR